MTNVWFTADLHLGHTNIIKYCKRPFKDISHMNSELHLMFNVCKPRDIIFILGDLGFDRQVVESLLKQLKFQKLFVFTLRGNHDSKEVIELMKEYSTYMGGMNTTEVEDIKIVLSHYAMHEWPDSHFNSWNLHGHSHRRHTSIGKQYDVGVDNNNFKLVPYTQIYDKMKTKENNSNYLQKQ